MKIGLLLRNEIRKMSRRARTYLGPIGLTAIVLPTAIGLKYSGFDSELEGYLRSGVQLYGSPINGLFLARMVLLPTMMVFLPLSVSLVAGDQISGEAADGTLRGLLTRPVTRMNLLIAKFAASALYAIAVTIFLGVAALGIGWAMFGLGGLVSPGQMTFFGMREGLERLLLAYGYASLAMLPVVSVAFMLSVFVSNSLTPVVGTLVLLLVSIAVGEIPYFHSVRPWLITTYFDVFQRAFGIPVEWAGMRAGLLVFAGWTAATLSLASLVFVRKDILS